MRIAVSNIAWNPEEQADVLPLLAGAGVTGIEIAPSMVWPGWQGATPEAAAALRAELAAQGFAVPALQSILFGRPDLSLFGEEAPLAAHIAQVAALAQALGAPAMVFGSPRNRLRGDLAADAAMDLAATRLHRLGAICADAGTALAIEANPPQYGGDFVLCWTEAAALVARADHPGIVLHLDTACTAMAGDDPVAAATATARQIRHFHASAPQLAPPDGSDGIDHPAIATALRAGGYTGWVSLEMRRAPQAADTLRGAITRVVAAYA